jgi:transcriptional regulator with XRE-family HTH domain
MPKKPLESLGAIVREKRGTRKLRETAHEIGISAATLLRVEAGRIPDVETFGKLCIWLKRDPNEFLGTVQPAQSYLSVSLHFKADKNPKPETVNALAKMVLFAVASQTPTPDIEG